MFVKPAMKSYYRVPRVTPLRYQNTNEKTVLQFDPKNKKWLVQVKIADNGTLVDLGTLDYGQRTIHLHDIETKFSAKHSELNLSTSLVVAALDNLRSSKTLYIQSDKSSLRAGYYIAAFVIKLYESHKLVVFMLPFAKMST